MSLVADIKPEKNSNKKAHGSTAHKEATGGHENSEYDGAFDYQPSQGPFPNRPSVPVDILASTVYRGPTIRRVSEFAMILEQKPRALRALCHTCTSIQSETASTPKALAEVNNWRERYPPLAAYYDQGQIECPIFFFDTRLSLMDHWPSDLTLTIPLTVDFSQGAHFTEWRSCSRFYKRNGGLVDSAEFHLDSESSDRLDFSQIKGIDDSTLVQIPFRSKWWVQVFSKMLERRIMMRRNNGDPELIREEEESDIQGLCIMQEIWATHRVYKHQQKMAILLWKFSTVRGGEVATTSWRRLIPPLPAYVIQSPHPPSEKPPMILDTTLQAASPYVAQPSIFSGYPTDDLLTAPLSGGNLPSPTPTPESRSFPSSTSTSFPSSVLNSTYPLYPSQESSFHSQDSAYRTLASFNSHDSGYPLYEHHESFEASHESYGSHEFVDGSQESYGSQEVISHSQDSLYQHAPDQLYEYPYPSVDPPITASACQDFTGGQIHLSYAQSEEDSHSSYEAPLIAPQANMMPQHQLIQHPEHFDQHDFLDDTPDDLVSGHHDQLDEQAHVQPLPQCYELNGLAIDYNAWEEALRMNPDLERHLGIEAVDEVGDIDQQYMGTVGHETLGSMPGEVLGEVQDRGADTPEEYQ